MNRKTTEILTAMFLVAILWACGSTTPQSTQEEVPAATEKTDTAAVATQEPLMEQMQEEILLKSGKVKASKYIDLYFSSQGHIAGIYARTGERVDKGTKLAELETFSLNTDLKQADIDIRQAYLELQDIVIGQGYDPEKPESVPENIMKLAGVKSGYESAVLKKERIVHQIAAATITAPFSGIVANLTAKPNQLVSSGEPLCRIIQDRDMEIEFHVLESELHLVGKGQKVAVEPAASSVQPVNGEIMEINPIVDEKGLIRIKALVKGYSGLMEGMNVTVRIHQR
jgi:multidrug efflux pump subunit AcrA (membrane-fusion protein)